MIVFLLSGFLPCCLAASAQVSAGPTLDTSGVMAVRVNAGFSFGIALPESSAATVGLGVQAGTEAPLSITGSYAYTRIDGALGARAELLTTASLIGSTGTVELAPSVLFVRHQSRSESAASEKSFSALAPQLVAGPSACGRMAVCKSEITRAKPPTKGHLVAYLVLMLATSFS